MLLYCHISAYARCLAGKVCGLVQSTWGTCQGEDKPGARDKILNTKVACWAFAGQTFPQGCCQWLQSGKPLQQEEVFAGAHMLVAAQWHMVGIGNVPERRLATAQNNQCLVLCSARPSYQLK